MLLQGTWTWANFFERQRGLARCSPWDRRESDATGWLKNNHHVSWPGSKSFSPWGLWLVTTVCCVLCLVAQLYPALWDPMNCSPPGSSVHVGSPGKNTGVGYHALLQGNLPNQRIEPKSPASQANSLPSEPPGKLVMTIALFNTLIGACEARGSAKSAQTPPIHRNWDVKCL